MVNVSGRSKGCSNCRRRRIKCDENRPVCLRCQKGSLECDGPRGTAFIEGTIVKSRRSQKPMTAWTKRDFEEQDFTVQSIPQFNVLLRHNDGEVYVCYAQKHLHPGGTIDAGLQGLQLADITTAGRKRANAPVFKQALLSFATVYFGVQHRQTNILTEGYAMHGAALKQLNHALSDSSCIRDEVIHSVITLAILECIVPSGPKNYLKHMLGLERLLELRQPDSPAHCSTKSSTLYKSVKYMILLASVRTRKPSILARPEWKAVMRVNCTAKELEEQDLCEVLADCTVLLAERDKLMARWSSDFDMAVGQRARLARKAQTLLTFLHVWKERWDGDERNASSEEFDPLFDGQSSPASSGSDDSPYLSTNITFETESVTRMFMLYSTTMMHVLQILTSLPYGIPGGSVDETPSPTPSSYTAREDDVWNSISNADWAAAERLAALQVGRCIPNYLEHLRARSHAQFASPVVQWAVTSAWIALGGNETTEGRWMMDLMSGRNSRVFVKGVRDI